MPETINTPSIAAALIHSNHRFRKELMLITVASILECTKHMRVINGLKGKETEATIVPQAHFRPYKDFGRISLLNTALCFGAGFYGWPMILWRKLKKSIKR